MARKNAAFSPPGGTTSWGRRLHQGTDTDFRLCNLYPCPRPGSLDFPPTFFLGIFLGLGPCGFFNGYPRGKGEPPLAAPSHRVQNRDHDAVEPIDERQRPARRWKPVSQAMTLNLGKTPILVLLALGASQAQQSAATSQKQQAPQTQLRVTELYKSASEGNKTALDQLRTRAEQGNPEAQFSLGWIYDNGQSVPTDAVQALAWYRKAAEGGNSEAQNNLGWIYENGAGVPKNAALARNWYLKAAEQGYADAQLRLDVMTKKRVVQMVQRNGVYVVPVLINNAITLDFVLDTGAADVSVPEDVVTTLMRTGTITKSDIIGARTYTLADGSTTSSATFRIRSLKLGDTVLENVTGSIADAKGTMLLGLSFLDRFKSVTIDNTKHTLALE